MVRQQVLLGDVGDILRILVLCEQVIERLIFRGADLLRYRQPPFLCIAKYGVDVENNSAKREESMLHNLPDRIFRAPLLRHRIPRIISYVKQQPALSKLPWYPDFRHYEEAPSFAATRSSKSTMTLACFQVASSCIFPSTITAPVPSGIASRMRLAKAASAGSGVNTRRAISIWDGWSVQAPAQP